jgi:hypothetical protein
MSIVYPTARMPTIYAMITIISMRRIIIAVIISGMIMGSTHPTMISIIIIPLVVISMMMIVVMIMVIIIARI